MNIRLLQEADAEAYRALKLRALDESPEAFSDSYEDEVDAPLQMSRDTVRPVGDPPESFALGAFDDAELLIGAVTFRRDTRRKARHKAMVHVTYVDPSLRHEGVGRALVAELLERARRLVGLEQVHLWVLRSPSHSAAGFYERFGFQSQGVVKRDLKIGSGYVDAEYMVLYL